MAAQALNLDTITIREFNPTCMTLLWKSLAKEANTMTTIATALQELGVTEWVLRGEPTTEAGYRNVPQGHWRCNGSAIEKHRP